MTFLTGFALGVVLTWWFARDVVQALKARHVLAMTRFITEQVTLQRAQDRIAAVMSTRLSKRTGHHVQVMPVRQWVRYLPQMTAEVVGTN